MGCPQEYLPSNSCRVDDMVKRRANWVSKIDNDMLAFLKLFQGKFFGQFGIFSAYEGDIGLRKYLLLIEPI